MPPSSLKSQLKDFTVFALVADAYTQSFIQKNLRSEGYKNLAIFSDSDRLFLTCSINRPRLLLLDAALITDRDNFLARLKGCLHELPNILFLADMRAQQLSMFHQQTFCDYVSKPLHINELLLRIENALALEHTRHELKTTEKSLDDIVKQRISEIKSSHLEVVQKLGRAAEFRDNETGFHIQRMSNISALLARSLGLPDDESQNILHASTMHDIGKIGIPDRILLKPGKFTPEEWQIMQSHTTLGARILAGNSSKLLNMASEIALSHHEKWDGSGYPSGLSGQNIPISCRIVAIADVFDALTSERPYKRAWQSAHAQEWINRESGRHFDPEVVHAFNAHFAEILLIRNRFKDSEKQQDNTLLTSYFSSVQRPSDLEAD